MNNDPVLLFQPATHGSFLARTLNVASGVCEDFDFYGDKIGAHNKVPNKSNQIVNYIHESITKDVFVYINIKPSDLYIINWHNVMTSCESGLDFLSIKDFQQLRQLIENMVIQTKNDHLFVSSFLTTLKMFENDGTSGLREMFKTLRKELVSMLQTQSDIYAKHNVSNIFEFSWFYDKEIFVREVKILLEKLGYEYKVDISHHQQEFIDRKQNILESKRLVELAFKCYTKKVSMDISGFCIYEQAYLDYLIEQHLGYEIENWQEYPKNTLNMNPTEAWEGVRYEL